MFMGNTNRLELWKQIQKGYCSKCGEIAPDGHCIDDKCAHINFRPVLTDSVETLKRLEIFLNDDERKEIWSEITSGYCKECGTNNPQCQCWNDE